jgi:hypothetical protein
MKIKNKYEVSFAKLVEQTKKEGGLPKEIVISIKEAQEIIDEMGASSGGKPDTSFQVSFPTDQYNFRVSRLIWEGELTPDQVLEVLNAWYKNEFVITFDKIPVRIERKRTPPPPTEYAMATKPKFPENETIRWWKFWKR